MRCTQQFDVVAGNEIKAMSEVDNRADHRRFFVFASVALPLGPFQGALWVRFPKIRSRSKPVVVSIALENRSSLGHGPLCDRSVAAMISEYE